MRKGDLKLPPKMLAGMAREVVYGYSEASRPIFNISASARSILVSDIRQKMKKGLEKYEKEIYKSHCGISIIFIGYFITAFYWKDCRSWRKTKTRQKGR